jgi:hypothetical protein
MAHEYDVRSARRRPPPSQAGKAAAHLPKLVAVKSVLVGILLVVMGIGIPVAILVFDPESFSLGVLMVPAMCLPFAYFVFLGAKREWKTKLDVQEGLLISDLALERSTAPPEGGKEELITAVFGVHPNSLTEVGVAVGKVGLLEGSHDSLFVTDQRIIVADIPTGDDQLAVSGVPVQHLRTWFATDTISDKARELTADLEPQQILEMRPHNYDLPFRDLKEVHFRVPAFMFSVRFVKNDGTMRQFMIVRPADVERLVETLRPLLGDKVRVRGAQPRG